MKKLFIANIILSSFFFVACGGTINDIKCGTTISELKHLEIEYISTVGNFVSYKSENDGTRFGSVEPKTFNYIFWHDQYFGKVYSIVGKDSINEVLRYFAKRLEQLYDQNPKEIITPIPMERKDGSWLIMEPKRTIIVRRFSLNLGQVSVLCRDLWEKHTGISDKKEKR